MGRVRVAACQINTVVGDLEGNAERILAALARAEEGGADLAVFPELTVTGYPPEDLLSRPAFVADNLAVFDRIAEASGPCAAVVGYVDTDGSGRSPQCRGPLCRRAGSSAGTSSACSPTTGSSTSGGGSPRGGGPRRATWWPGCQVGISICEDMWFAGGPMADQARAGAGLLVNLNASPYSRGRRDERLAVLSERVAETGCAIVYVNQVGGQDELVFDGASLVMGADGSVVASAAQFSEQVLLVDLDVEGRVGGDAPAAVEVSTGSRAGVDREVGGVATVLDPEAEVYEALVLGTRDYVAKNGFTDAVIGLSGGIDSSLVATVAVDALGPTHVHGVTMPSRYSSEGSVGDAVTLARNLGIDIATVAIEPTHQAFATSLLPLLGGEPTGLTDENLQSRLRGVLLMALSNARGWIVLTTGNKSEMATGYSTLYGDSAGGFAVIKDVPKLLVYELCRYRNRRAGFDLIPDPVLTKAPSAELRPDQRDDESLPPYSVLDPVMEGYVEGDRSADDLVAEGFDAAAVDRVIGLVDRAEYKRRQMPPGVRISGKAFGKDRRMPITNHYRSKRTSGGAGPHRSRRSGRDGAVGRVERGDAGRCLTWPIDQGPRRAPTSRRRPGPRLGVSPLPLEASATLVGEYRWIEHALYRLLGEWVTDMPIAAVQVHLDAQSMRHAWHAELWAERLPVRAGDDPDGWTTPSGPSAALFTALSGTALPLEGPGSTWPPAGEDVVGPAGALPRLAGLYRVVLPRLVTTYQRHLGGGRSDDRRSGGTGPAPGAQRRDRGLARRGAAGGAVGQPSPRRGRGLRVPPAPRNGRWWGPAPRRDWWPFRGLYQGSDPVVALAAALARRPDRLKGLTRPVNFESSNRCARKRQTRCTDRRLRPRGTVTVGRPPPRWGKRRTR